MFTGFLYLFSFLVGVFVVWKLGRDEYYDEEKLIDLVLFPTSLGLIVARASFFFTHAGTLEWQVARSMPSVWLTVSRLFQLNSGALWWVGGLAAATCAVWLLWRWRWPYWPMLGILILGVAIVGVVSEVLFWPLRGLISQGVVLGISAMILLGSVFFLRADGGQRIKVGWRWLVGRLAGWQIVCAGGNRYNVSPNMTNKEISEQLNQDLAEVREQIERLDENDPASNPLRALDNNSEEDTMESEAGFRMESIIERLKEREYNLLVAIANVKAGSFGVCTDCGQEIDPRRMAAIPSTMRCLDCQEKHEE